jgi:hypothetical protein
MPQKHCHILIADTAKEMAGSLYEELALDDLFYKINPSQKAFIASQWGKFVPQARATLAQMLETDISDSLKLQIEDALIKDNALRHTPGV